MKRKHYGLASLLILAAGLLASVVYAVVVLTGDEAPLPVVRVKPLPNSQLPNRAGLEELNRLEASLGALSDPRPTQEGLVDLALFGRPSPGMASADASTATSVGTPSGPAVEMNYTISMAFSGGSKRFCVIDGVLYKPGAKLPDGGRIDGITPQRVMITKKGITAWVPVKSWHLSQEPAEGMVLGRAQPEEGSVSDTDAPEPAPVSTGDQAKP